ncbi:hypothetical protein Tsubulata_006754 [Turnera subulata]|uniref:PWWP domain-containing protein n=1 Tax=Turnera subulata TaxID=218843 RepID=A0A9Q0FEP2_9ROSI|nr:hypothetical protein Tsubulata_006754 [Turnera subulata]
MGHRRGDIVWARVTYPHKWWPALIHRTHDLGVTVTFFNLHKPRHLPESEVCSFADNFGSLAETVKCGIGRALLDIAVGLLGRRVVRGLKCPCQYPEAAGSLEEREGKRGMGLFDGNEALGFVLRVAVSPLVDDSQFVAAVLVVNQLRVFRGFLVAQTQRKMLVSDKQSDNSEQQRKTSQQDQPKQSDSLFPLVPYSENKLKRQHHQQTDFDFLPKLQKIMPLFSFSKAYAFLQKSKHGYKNSMSEALISGLPFRDVTLNVCNTAPGALLPGVDSRLQTNRSIFEANKPVTSCSGTHSKVEIQSQGSLRAEWLETMSWSRHRIPDTFKVLLNCTTLGSNTFHVSLSKEGEESIDATEKNETCIPPIQMQGIGACLYAAKNSTAADHRKDITDGRKYCTLTLLQRCTSQVVPNCGRKAHSNNGNAGAATNNCLLPHATTDLPTSINRRDDATPCGTNKGMGVDHKGRQQSGGDMSLKPLIARQPFLDASAKCKTLHMKFPKGFIIPSKNELIKKFNRFGIVDTVRTKIFSWVSSARVVFLHELDAVVAYQYVKKKNVLGASKILFWLDQHEHKRRGSMSLSSAGNLRSCLKNSNHRRKEDKERSQRVRFTVET